MNSIGPAFWFRDAPRRTSGRWLVLALVLTVAAVLGDASAGLAAGPLALRTEVPLGFRAHDIILDGTFAYVATERGLTILDISDPVRPIVRSSELSTRRNRSQGLAKKGAYIYLAAGRAGMQVIDVSNPDDPVTVATASKAGTVYDVAVHPTGDAAYAITYSGELYVWNIANPAAPVLTQTLGIRPWRGVCAVCLEAMRNHVVNGSAQAVGVSTAGNVVVGVDWAYGGGYVWDSTNPLQLTFRGTHRAPVGFRAEVDLARDVVYYLATYAWMSGVYTVPLSLLTNGAVTYPADPPNLPWPAGTDLCTNAEGCDFMPSSVAPYSGGIGFSGNYVFYAAPRGNGELGVVDATDPGNLVKVASAPLGITAIGTAQATGVASRGNIIYVAAGLRGVQVWEFPGLAPLIDESTRLRTQVHAERTVATPWLRSRPAKIGAVLLVAVLSLVAFEVVVAAVPHALMPGPLRTMDTFYARRAHWRALTTGDAYLGVKLRPDVEVRFPFEGGSIPIRTTSHGLGPIGFRDIGTRGPFGAIVIGDSFVFCDEVVAESCWVRLLAKASGVSMATLGVSGYSTLAEARVLKRYGPAFGAPLVLVGVFPNDLADSVNFDEWSRSGTDDLALWLQGARGRHPASRWLEDHSTVYRLLTAALRERGREIHRHRAGDLDLVFRFDDWWMDTMTAPDRHPGWPLVQQGLLDMQRTAAEMRAQLVVLIFPTKEEAYWDIARRYLPAPETVDADRLPRLLTRFLAEHAMLGCDLTGEIREEARRGRQLYHRVSGHFNDEGNRVAATAIGRCLANRRLLGAARRSGLPSDGRSAG